MFLQILLNELDACASQNKKHHRGWTRLIYERKNMKLQNTFDINFKIPDDWSRRRQKHVDWRQYSKKQCSSTLKMKYCDAKKTSESALNEPEPLVSSAVFDPKDLTPRTTSAVGVWRVPDHIKLKAWRFGAHIYLTHTKFRSTPQLVLVFMTTPELP